jgi:hypothetical protein
MQTFRSYILPLLLLLHGLLIVMGALSALKDPTRAASQYLPAAAEGARELPASSALVLFLAPFQLLAALLMFRTAFGIVKQPDAAALRDMAFVVGALGLMELGFAGARLRVNALRGSSPVWHFPPGNGVISASGTLTSLVFALVYGLGAYALSLG